HIKRPLNAFMLFRKWFIESQQVSAKVEGDPRTLSSIAGAIWDGLSEVERQTWYAKAKVAKEEHKRRYPDYVFR
ncbi:high mobility group box domain-containing protein, partial [Lentinula edodes]